MKYINLTARIIRYVVTDGARETIVELPPSGVVCNVEERRSAWKQLPDGMPVIEIALGDPTNLPPPQDNVIYVVNSYVAQAVGPDRDDIVSPELLGSLYIDGKIHACRAWRVYA